MYEISRKTGLPYTTLSRLKNNKIDINQCSYEILPVTAALLLSVCTACGSAGNSQVKADSSTGDISVSAVTSDSDAGQATDFGVKKIEIPEDVSATSEEEDASVENASSEELYKSSIALKNAEV